MKNLKNLMLTYSPVRTGGCPWSLQILYRSISVPVIYFEQKYTQRFQQQTGILIWFAVCIFTGDF
jgi:hypothetical protein